MLPRESLLLLPGTVEGLSGSRTQPLILIEHQSCGIGSALASSPT